jgi:hypothetical protein
MRLWERALCGFISIYPISLFLIYFYLHCGVYTLLIMLVVFPPVVVYRMHAFMIVIDILPHTLSGRISPGHSMYGLALLSYFISFFCVINVDTETGFLALGAESRRCRRVG